MGKRILKVWDDFHQKDFKQGDVVSFFEGSVRILDMDHKNEFGSFIQCEYVNMQDDLSEMDGERVIGIRAQPENPYEIVGAIHVPGYRNLLGGIGFFVRNREVNEVVGYTYQQTWHLIFHKGAVNAEASKSMYKMFHSKLIDTIAGLPALDSAYWKIPAYNQQGKPYSFYTKEALQEIRKGIGYAVRNRVRDINNQKAEIVPDFSKVNQVTEKIKKSKRIVVLAGAGLSTNSGILDYRSTAEGLWLKNPAMLEHLNQAAFEKSPNRFWLSFYKLIEQSLSTIVPFPTENALLATLEAIEPNEGHRFIAWLSKELGKNITVIGQNVDGLEKKAGIGKVIQMHGNIHECICPSCKKIYPLTQVLKKGDTPKCECQTVLRPNVVFFGDQVYGFEKAKKVIEKADLLLVVGTGLEVYPFNQLPDYRRDDTEIVLLNGTLIDGEFDYVIKGDMSAICRRLKKQLQG